MGPIIACLEHGDEKFDYIEEGCTNLKKKAISRLKILAVTKVTQSKFHTED
jgi:hypothetical protein